ncbi:FadR/GntR family transcriptional regulator [Formosa sp. 4Alg 33]|uniref:FadR/GntR family transcriptional regulator n=1 Tax=Formosa sp. 4Alg 33 TaxID=3382189 RepID=UPI003D9C23CF
MNFEITEINNQIDVQNIIISKIKDYITLKNLELGDKLPSQRVLAEMFNVSRKCVGDAIQKLEFYGVLKSVPQSGTFVENIGKTAINGILEDIVTLVKDDFLSLVETRLMLEAKTVSLAAKRRTVADLYKIEEALKDYKTKVLNGENAVEEDLMFHLAIAKASGNTTINALMLQITPKIILFFEETRVCNENVTFKEIQNHEAIFNAIKSQNINEAIQAMEVHFEMLVELCNNFER